MLALACLLTWLVVPLAAQDRLVLGATTTTENSGLLAAILPAFSAETGIRVDVVALGTRQILAMAENGDLDAVLTHHPPSEAAFIAAGYGAARFPVMFNDFVLIGPENDPANIATAPDAATALARIAAAQADFISRGDESGTHLRELALWAESGVEPTGGWYRKVGAGMGASLNIASALNAYILSDRATWLAFSHRGELALLFEGGAALRNDYALITLNPARFPHVNAAAAEAFATWITGPQGQGAIAGYRLNGQALFCPALPQAADQQGDACAAGQPQR